MKAFLGWVLTVSLSVMLGLLLYSTSLSGSPTEYQEVVVSPQPAQTIIKTRTKVVRAPGSTGGAQQDQAGSGSSGYSGGSGSSESGETGDDGDSGGSDDLESSGNAPAANRNVPVQRSRNDSDEDSDDDRSDASNSRPAPVVRKTAPARPLVEDDSDDEESSSGDSAGGSGSDHEESSSSDEDD